jgi:predicted DNA-binding protein
MKSATKNFHLPLPEGAYEELRREAARDGRPATTVAREAIEEWLERRRKKELHEQIAEYAAAHKGSDADLDRSLEQAAVRHLRKAKR